MTDTLRNYCSTPIKPSLVGLTDRPLSLPATAATGKLPIVAIGASAGGAAAVAAFCAGLSHVNQPDTAYVLIQHLPAEGAPSLVTRLQQATKLQVCEIVDGMSIQANRLYISPGESHVTVRNGCLQLAEPPKNRMDCLPIDCFFRSLAEDQGCFATAIILSGTGSDGSLGLRAIKAKGGMVMVQAPESAAHGGMPRSAIATGMVDAILAPQAMGNRFCDYLAYGFGRLAAVTPTRSRAGATALAAICATLKGETGRDFSTWETDTIAVQVERRMALQQIDTPERYNKFLRHSPGEVKALCREVLIDTPAFSAQPEV